MPNVFTDTSGSSLGTSLVQAAYDRYVEFQLRSQPLIRTISDKRPAQQAMPGSSVVLQFYPELADATTPLVETTDPDSVIVGNTTNISITLNEYGNATLTTRKLNEFALAPVDPAVANLIAYNAASSIDRVSEAVLRGGTNVVRKNGASFYYNGGTTVGVTGTDVASAKHFRTAVVKLRGQSAVPRRGTLYQAFVHPDVSYDLRTESGSGAWRLPHEYQDTNALYAGEIGVFEGAVFVENPRLYTATDGAASAKVYRSYVVGQQALAEAVAVEPNVVLGPITDKLKRFQPIGWYGLLGFAIYRQASLVRVESASAIV